VKISGQTAICFTLACPVGHVRTPAAFNDLAQRRGADFVMTPLEVTSADLAGFIGLMRRIGNVAGAVVTVPHKTAAAQLCDTVSPRARQCNAVNVIRRDGDGALHGDMFDGLGFVEGLRRAGQDLAGRSVLLAGAGGAASAIAFALADAGVARLGVCNRTQRRAEDLTERLRQEFSELDVSVAAADPSGFDIIVNATSLGLKPGDDAPVDVAKLKAGQLAAEVVMQPERTGLLEAAAAAGARTHPGRAMLDAQLDLIADFLGAQPHRGRKATTGYKSGHFA